MENNKVCYWLLHYSGQDSTAINLEIDIEDNLSIKERFCSTICYFDCGHVLFDDFPSNSTGFDGILNYLVNNNGNIMEKMEDDELQVYIDKLRDCINFSVRHHVSIIKCLMKCYVCLLAPSERINKSIEALGIFGSMDNAASTITFRHIQRNLCRWLKEAARMGLMRLFKSTKNVSHLEASSILDSSSIGSLLLYAMKFYVGTKMIKYSVTVPDVGLSSNSVQSKSNLSLDHSRIVMASFSDICDSRDILPMTIDCLLSRSMDNVPATLTVALIFHWIIGNSLKHLNNLLKRSISSTKSNKITSQPQVQVLSNNFGEVPEPQICLQNNTEPLSNSFRPLFTKEKLTDDNSTVSQPMKVLTCQYSDLTAKPIPLSLKEEFQKKLKEKQSLVKSTANGDVCTGNETTWFAQSNKNTVTHIPLTPKKTMKSDDTVIDSGLCLSKSQLNQIQIQLSLRRQKIENEQKTIADQTERRLENFKQKAFFRAIDMGTKVVRRKSLELVTEKTVRDRIEADKRLSMYIKRTENLIDISSSKEMNQSFGQSVTKDDGAFCVELCEVNNVMEPPQSSQSNEVGLLPVELCLDQIVGDKHPVLVKVDSILSNEHPETIPRQNNLQSMLSLSRSTNNTIFDKKLITKHDYQRSIEYLSTSVNSLQEEIQLLRQQQLCWNTEVCDIEMDEINSVKNKTNSENNSVAETPKNNGISLTEISDLPKPITEPSLSINIMESNAQLRLVNEESCRQHKVEDKIEPIHNISQGSKKLSHDNDNQGGNFKEQCKQETAIINVIESCSKKELLIISANGSMTEDDMTSSSESAKDTIDRPLSFVIIEEQVNPDVFKKMDKFRSKREEKRQMNVEIFRQKRELGRENKTVNDGLLKQELNKGVDEDKRNSLSKTSSDCKNELKTSDQILESRSLKDGTKPLKSMNKSQTIRPNIKSSKQESSASPRKNTCFSSIGQNQRFTSSSTSKLNASDSMNGEGPLLTSEYIGPKLFAKNKVKTNRSVIANAISHCCLAGSVNIPVKEAVLDILAEAEGTHFIILFRDARCQYRSLYLYNVTAEDLTLINGNGPRRITHEMVERFFKYNSGTKQFNAIMSMKHLSTAVDAICIKAGHWNTRPTGPILTGAISTSSISQVKTKR